MQLDLKGKYKKYNDYKSEYLTLLREYDIVNKRELYFIRGWRLKLILFESIDELKEYISKIAKIHSGVRIIDEHHNCIFGDDELENIKCYHFWGQEDKCEVCLYKRALENEKPVMKIVSFKDNIFVIKSSVAKVGGKKYIIECVDDMQDRIFFESKHLEFKGPSYIISINNNLSEFLKDTLTNLYDRKYINSRLPSDIEYAKQTNQPLSILMIDIDFFKKVNDEYGHIVGDYVLTKFANLLEVNIRNAIEWIGRYGGEEFIVVLPNTNYDDAYSIANRIRKVVEDTTFTVDEKNIDITCSIGVYTMINNLDMNMQTLISCVDKRLYLAKQFGRNRVE